MAKDSQDVYEYLKKLSKKSVDNSSEEIHKPPLKMHEKREEVQGKPETAPPVQVQQIKLHAPQHEPVYKPEALPHVAQKLGALKKELHAIQRPEFHENQKTSIIEQEKEALEFQPQKAETWKRKTEGFIKSGIGGFDQLFEKGIPKGTSVLVVGGPGSGKTIFCLQVLYNAAKQGEKCLYLSFEESEERLKQHMRDFSWDVDEMEKKGLLVIKRVDIYEISRSIEAMLAKVKGELMIDIEGLSGFIPEGFKPDRIVIDSVTALSAAFARDEGSSYRSYIEQSFLFLERLGATSFLISETEDAPHKLSPTGVEEFLADGVVILYNIRKGDVRERALEILKMRGSKFKEKIVAVQVTDGGIVVYPEQQVFGGIGMDVH